MPDVLPIQELDQLITQAREARVELRKLIEGITPDDHGVVTTTADAAGARADELRTRFDSLQETGRAMASVIDDLHPQTGGSYEEFSTVADEAEGRLGHASVGHSDAGLTGSAGETDTMDAEEAGTSRSRYYGV